jgi:hypothetical protein
MEEKPSRRWGLSFSDGFNFGLGFWTAGLIFYVLMGIILFGLFVILPALGCGLLSSLNV